MTAYDDGVFIGICLLANHWMRLAVWRLMIEFVGVRAPLVRREHELSTDRLAPGCVALLLTGHSAPRRELGQ